MGIGMTIPRLSMWVHSNWQGHFCEKKLENVWWLVLKIVPLRAMNIKDSLIFLA